jgi:hypothetical protein
LLSLPLAGSTVDIAAPNTMSTHQIVYKTARLILSATLKATATQSTEELEVLIPRSALSKLHWLVACDTSYVDLLSSNTLPLSQPQPQLQQLQRVVVPSFDATGNDSDADEL